MLSKYFSFWCVTLNTWYVEKQSLVEILEYHSSLKRPIILFLNDERKADLSATPV